MYEYITKLLPKGITRSYHELLRYNDVRIDSDRFTGFLLLFGIGAAFALAFDSMVLLSLPGELFFPIFVASFAAVQAIAYVWLSLAADAKARFVESILPDALRLMAMNLRAGMTADRAMLLAAKPEFGVLERELSKAGKQILAGKEVRYALLEIPKRIRSETLERTVHLITEGIESGGELSELLEQAAEDIQHTRLIQGEIQAHVSMYAIFIFMAAGVGAPLLLGISTYIVEVLGRQFARFPASVGNPLPIAQGSIAVSPDFLMAFAVASLSLTALFAGLIIGIIRKGNAREGMRYLLPLLILSLAVFFGVRWFVAGAFSF
ncbi:MAG: type II secretion system F family protein [Candidatus Aenigmarchaeota archaeon]|nr:type II secretion system F family protein [Candidatus Aenigmarchaeota archaeon]